MLEYFRRLLGRSLRVNTIVHTPDDLQPPPRHLSFLECKLGISLEILKAAQSDRLGSRILIIDPNYLNIRALRLMAGSTSRIITLVNGGAFQEPDLELQGRTAGEIERLRGYEAGFFGMCDGIILASDHARSLFLRTYPSLSPRVRVVPYPVLFPPIDLPASQKSGLLFPSRPSWEKGFDVVQSLQEEGVGVRASAGLPRPEHLQLLSSHKLVALPSRAELFGYCAIEAILAGTIPAAPDGLSYVEFLRLPPNLRLSHPVGPGTAGEIREILRRVDGFTDAEYAAVIGEARDHLREIFRNQDEKFEEAICER